MSKIKKNIEYAIVDIETTGGNASGSRMTEIAIRIHDGQNVIERFETLINPEKEIPLPIFALTGIDNDMVQDAPVFEDIAEDIFQLLESRVFVAHNVNFDYSFIRHQLEECGYKWNPRKLCTVRMARRIKPGLTSYSLGRLCDVLDIPIENRHRAGGDADATAILFSKLLQWDHEKVIPEMLKKTSKEQQLPPNLSRKDYDALPEKPGVYYFRDKAGKAIYVGKAINIKKRISAHFTGHNPNPQRQHFLRNIVAITYEVCATELMAYLLECIEIKRLWPPFNRALKRFEPKYGLLMYERMDGYLQLVVSKLKKGQPCIQVYNHAFDGVRLLRELVQRFDLDTRFCHFEQQAGTSASPNIRTELDELPDRDSHNQQVAEAIQYLHNNRPSFAILDKGRHPEEKSCIWVEQGNFYAMGYIHSTSDLSTPEDIRDSLTRYSGNHYMMQLINAYAHKHPTKVIRISPGVENNRKNDYEDVMNEGLWFE